MSDYLDELAKVAKIALRDKWFLKMLADFEEHSKKPRTATEIMMTAPLLVTYTVEINAEYETGREREQLQEVIDKLNAPPPRSAYIVGGPEGEWPPKFTVYNSPAAPSPDETDDTHDEWRRLNEVGDD